MKKEIKTMGDVKLEVILMIILFCSFFSDLNSQLEKYQLKHSIRLNSVSSIVKRYDSTYLIAQSGYWGAFQNHFDVISLDENGTIKWNRRLPIPYVNSQVRVISNTKDSGFVVGVTHNELINSTSLIINTTRSNIGIAKYDKNGNLNWKSKFGLNNTLQDCFFDITRIVEDSYNSIYVIGRSDCDTGGNKMSRNNGSEDYIVVKYDMNGNKLWDQSFGGSSYEEPYHAFINNDTLFILGLSMSNNSGNKTSAYFPYSDYWTLKLNLNGNLINQKSSNYLTGTGFSSPNFSNTNFVNKNNNEFRIFCRSNNNGNSILTVMDNNFNVKKEIVFENSNNLSFIVGTNGSKILSTVGNGFEIIEINDSFKIIDKQSYLKNGSFYAGAEYLAYQISNGFLIKSIVDTIGDWSGEKRLILDLDSTASDAYSYLIWLLPPKHFIKGKIFPDFNSNCNFNSSSEYNIKNLLVLNSIENIITITNDSNYIMYLFDRDTAVLKIINLDSNLYVSCGKDSIVLDMTGKLDTSGIDFPIRSNKTGSCVKINSFSHTQHRQGNWSTFQLNYQNNALDTAYNAYIDVEIDTAKIDSISSPYSYTLTGNIIRFQIGNVRPFGNSSITYKIKIKISFVLGSSICHRARIFPNCNVFQYPSNDSSVIELQMRCLPNDTVEVQLKNIGSKNQHDWGIVKSYEDIIILKADSFKLNMGDIIKFKHKLDTNKVYTAEIFNNNNDPIHPVLIRHDDQCTNNRTLIQNNPVLMFNRHDEAREYEEDCDVVRGSYDPNIKSAIPIGLFSEHYTATGTELKYRIDFQNTGTDTAFRVVLIDTLSDLLNIATFIPGISSHPYSVEFGGRAVKFIFDPIKLVDSFHNEPASHGFVTFKIKHNQGIMPKSKIENKADIYFDYNAPVRTNTVFNTIFDTIQVYIPKGGSTITGTNNASILVFPNPTTDKFYVQLNEVVKDLSIEIYDNQGKWIKSVNSNNNQLVEVSAEGLSTGLYHIRCMSGDKLIVVKKIIVN